ncbi:hypothetical protein ACH5RR_025908 [Cinchona calisaya]|uniref:Protein PHYTOCHROME KINASE SUBSTRATE 3-like n=1 Tax=Cinchona calisaya TaxID=153742 RepID=A0ABD2Z2X9_9GENT
MDAEDNLANLRVASFSYYLKPGDESFVQKIAVHIDNPLPEILSQETSFPITPRRTKSPIIEPSHNFNFSHSLNSQTNLSNHRVAALFSPHHLNDAQENSMFTVKSPFNQDINTALLNLPRTSPTHFGRINSTNGEIGVFGADKYFNMRLEYGTRTKHENRNEELVGVYGPKPKLRPGTPSISSEATSWNSQVALLQNLPQNVSQTRQRMATGRRIFATFGCSGPCLDKGALYAAENQRGDSRMVYGENVSQLGSKRVDNHFAFPVPNAEAANMLVKKQLDEGKSEDPRKSLEVFGSDRMKRGDIATSLARKLSMLTWDAIPKASNPQSITVGSTTICDDMTSDASSDLFEIENISGTGYPILSTETDDNMSSGCLSPPTQYAPSEASIEWSVVTASAADYSSVISDFDEKNIGISGDFITANAFNKNSRTNTVDKEAQKGRPGGLLGCKSQKAVSVVETVYKTRVERY